MANLILTTDCQRKCSYCFAQEDRDKNIAFTWDNFITASNFISTIEPKLVNLLGGEPTLHKDFPKILEYLILNDFLIQVFTNGIVSEKRMDEIYKVLKSITLREGQLKFGVNVNKKEDRSVNETEMQNEFFKRFYKITYPAFTIYEKGTDLSFLSDLIQKYLLEPVIRLGIAMPVIGGKNKYLPIDQYRDAAQSIINLSKNSPNITITFDCGFPLCMFDMAEIRELSQNENNNFSFVCGQPLDIYPDLTITNCYPLSKLCKVNIKDFKNITEVYDFFRTGFMTPIGIYGQQCLDCQFFMKICFGGCKGFYSPKQ